jgi:hypothetical protein
MQTITVDVYSKEIVSLNILKVEVGTNCPQGGDWGQGGRTIFRLTNESCTGWEVTVDGVKTETPSKVELLLGGDTEAETFLEALKFAAATLRAELKSKALRAQLRSNAEAYKAEIIG